MSLINAFNRMGFYGARQKGDDPTTEAEYKARVTHPSQPLPSWDVVSAELAAMKNEETAASVNKERDRRLETFPHDGHVYDFNDTARQDISGAGTLALAAFAQNPAEGDLRWADIDEDFAWITHDNKIVPMDCNQCFAFAKAAARWRSDHIRAARTLKDMSPIPQDFENDSYWPKGT